jgi:hypothetical protein
VEVVPPIHSIGLQVPASIILIFSATISTREHTSMTGPLVYSWDFGDGTPPSRRGYHTYTSNGTFTITVTCRVAVAGSVDVQGQLVVEVFEGKHLDLAIQPPPPAVERWHNKYGLLWEEILVTYN